MSRRAPMTSRIPLKDAHAQDLMRKAGRVVALALAKIGDMVRPGVTTGELDAVAEQTIRGLGAVPAFLGYNGYPATACISLNEEVVHGIPGPRVLAAGDIVGVDLGAIVEGWYADAAYTFAVGEVSETARHLMAVGQQALVMGIEAARVGNEVRDIGGAVQRYAEAHGASVVRDLCGHGVGQKLHEEPQIPNYLTRNGHIPLVAGMTLAIEPMLNAGGPRVRLLSDDWTFVTMDGSLSVHYEHTVLIREDGPEILTALR
ncbi:MAG TPA: type I methionyl aminopeptidase [Armatimonadota bacterium]|jgi:methionyl aminopeptidase